VIALSERAGSPVVAMVRVETESRRDDVLVAYTQ
jgi:hypothetical protein